MSDRSARPAASSRWEQDIAALECPLRLPEISLMGTIDRADAHPDLIGLMMAGEPLEHARALVPAR